MAAEKKRLKAEAKEKPKGKRKAVKPQAKAKKRLKSHDGSALPTHNAEEDAPENGAKEESIVIEVAEELESIGVREVVIDSLSQMTLVRWRIQMLLLNKQVFLPWLCQLTILKYLNRPWIQVHVLNKLVFQLWLSPLCQLTILKCLNRPWVQVHVLNQLVLLLQVQVQQVQVLLLPLQHLGSLHDLGAPKLRHSDCLCGLTLTAHRATRLQAKYLAQDGLAHLIHLAGSCGSITDLMEGGPTKEPILDVAVCQWLEVKTNLPSAGS